VAGATVRGGTLRDLRKSGAIEKDSELIMFIYRDEYYTKVACKGPGVADQGLRICLIGGAYVRRNTNKNMSIYTSTQYTTHQ
jgi:replicative DNA helicase